MARMACFQSGRKAFYSTMVIYFSICRHLMLEGKNPLLAFLWASTCSLLVQSQTKPASIKFHQQAWNAFAQLLRITELCWELLLPYLWRFAENHHDICDGTLIGFWKDLMDAFDKENSHLQDPFKEVVILVMYCVEANHQCRKKECISKTHCPFRPCMWLAAGVHCGIRLWILEPKEPV